MAPQVGARLSFQSWRRHTTRSAAALEAAVVWSEQTEENLGCSSDIARPPVKITQTGASVLVQEKRATRTGQERVKGWLVGSHT